MQSMVRKAVLCGSLTLSLMAVSSCSMMQSKAEPERVVVTKTEYIRLDVPDDYKQCRYFTPDPACRRGSQRVYCNSQLNAIVHGLEDAQKCLLIQFKALEKTTDGDPIKSSN